MDREYQLIERVRRRFPSPKGILRVGIGDDAAVLRLGGGSVRALPSPGSAGSGLPLLSPACRTGRAGRCLPALSSEGQPGKRSSLAKSGARQLRVRALLGWPELRRGARQLNDWVITTDAFLENVHFLRNAHPPDSVGYKALARATSDIAAMGARPRYFFLTLGLPAECTGRWFDEFLGGMARAARRFGLILAGGDTTEYPLVVSSLTVLGEVDSGRAILRSGARPGDLICVSGRLGDAELGLRLLEASAGSTSSPQYRRPHGRLWGELTKKHFYPEPRLALGRWLAANRLATSMIDISDGLSTDLGHICKASRVGARIWSQKIPAVQIPPGLQRAGAGPASNRSASSKASIPPKARLDSLELALHSGEDYELLFTVPNKLADRLPKGLGGLPLAVIGEVTRSKRVLVVDERGRAKPLQPQGWDPFRTRGRR